MYTKPEKGYTIYTKSNCPGCSKMKELLPHAKMVNCDEYLDDVDGFLDFLGQLTDLNPTTFPMVFLDGQYLPSDKVFTTNEEF